MSCAIASEGSSAGSDKEAVSIAQGIGADIYINLDKDPASLPSKRSKKSERKSQIAESELLVRILQSSIAA